MEDGINIYIYLNVKSTKAPSGSNKKWMNILGSLPPEWIVK